MPEEFDFSRRKALAALGTVGVASAGAGLGTSAFFSDQDTFENNRLVAGELDLKVDWAQTYNGEPVNAFPDEDGDDVQDPIQSREQIAQESGLPIDSPSVETMFRDQFVDIPDDYLRPLIELEDVKPGDSGEITFSLHLFDNAGYIWMNGRCIENAENGIVEPERDDPDEVEASGPLSGELAQAIRVALWYDDGDNVHETDETIIFRGSLRELALLLCDGIALDGDRSTPFSSVNIVTGDAFEDSLLAANGLSDDRECFDASTTHHLGLRWELPVDHANELQTDSVRFDLGFYTEQCRHNSGGSQDDQVFADPLGDFVPFWCKYKVKKVLEDFTPPRQQCPLQENQIVCVTAGFLCGSVTENCRHTKGETTEVTVFQTFDPKDLEKKGKLCKVRLESRRTECSQRGCVGAHQLTVLDVLDS